jgi:hypothetical protein
MALRIESNQRQEDRIMRLQRDPGMRPSRWLGNAKTVGHKLSGGCDWAKRQGLILANHRKRAARANFQPKAENWEWR